MFGEKILILVPHPDDEIVACAAAIGRAKAQGATVYALYLTHGCIARQTLWPWQRKDYDFFVERRRMEAEAVAKFLDITPVGWSDRAARHLWRHMPEAHSEILAAIEKYGIDQIWVPAYEGGNVDHDALNAIGRVLAEKVSVIEFAEYNFANGRTHSQQFPISSGAEQTIQLTPVEEQRKRTALALYKSEQQNLFYVKLKQECFRPLAVYDYNLAPHGGTLWYARFQWVPFPHPRVDFTKPQEVSAAILRFLTAQA